MGECGHEWVPVGVTQTGDGPKMLWVCNKCGAQKLE